MQILRALIIITSFTGAISAYAAYTTSLNIDVTITKNIMGPSLQIETDKLNYTAIYRPSLQKFEDVIVYLKVQSPSSVVKHGYNLTFLDEHHQCAGLDINVQTKLDGNIWLKGITNSGLRFISDPLNDWNQHEIRLEYPVVPQIQTLQQCLGSVSLTASLEI